MDEQYGADTRYMSDKEQTKPKFGTVSIPIGILKDVDTLIEELGYWPSRGAFVREACIEKLRSEQQRLREIQTDLERRSALKKLRPGGLKGDQPPLKPET